MPAPVRRFVVSVIGSFTITAERSWAGPGRPAVWEIQATSGRRLFVKDHAGPQGYSRETFAYRYWTAALGTGRAPTLLAADPVTRAIVLTSVPGRSLHDLPLELDSEWEAFRQAGELLASLHAIALPAPADRADEAGWEAEAATMLRNAARILPPHDVAMLRTLTQQPPPPLPEVVAHADYVPRNWLWDPHAERLHIIDFERTGIESAARRDLSRLEYRVFARRPDLRFAFYQGYGRALTDGERRSCSAYAALDAVSALRWGLDHHDDEVVQQALTMLDALRAEHATTVSCGEGEVSGA
ncbi:aminoglycoside phosphotransferase family protein [Streptomyces sp. H39-C1]|uniref:aminoglycoside phosphotransferase family protein n=1 Tax=Streptomyces sp. H39-C1 TaxID=3004355 RepID=UPI0022AED308|nr:aminoglycoside phosphotransferase family protein [Streptomyces sp. H39-C1]MCZ4100756.1 aminoglycoside phosphotransferase family protein [Streptomyces sp. H39-C1]